MPRARPDQLCGNRHGRTPDNSVIISSLPATRTLAGRTLAGRTLAKLLYEEAGARGFVRASVIKEL